MDIMISRAERAGSHFFDKAAMSFFRSRIVASTVTRYGADTYRFVSSEQFSSSTPRQYSVREVTFYSVPDNNGTPREKVSHDTIGEFGGYADLRTAKRHLKDGL